RGGNRRHLGTRRLRRVLLERPPTASERRIGPEEAAGRARSLRVLGRIPQGLGALTPQQVHASQLPAWTDFWSDQDWLGSSAFSGREGLSRSEERRVGEECAPRRPRVAYLQR